MSSPYPVLGDRPIDQWRVTELKDELKKRKLMTKGLKEDLIKRLDEALRNEQEDLNKADSLGSVVQSEALPGIEMAEVTTSEKSEATVTITNEGKILHAQISCEQESGSLIVGEGAVHATNHGDSGDEKVDRNIHNLDINDSRGSMEEQVIEVQGVSGSDVTGLGGNQVAHVITEKTIEMVSETMETVVASKGEGLLDIGTQSENSDGKVQQDDSSKSLEALKGRELPDTESQNESSDGKVPLDGGSLQSLHGDSKDILSDMNDQVSETNFVEGHQVKCKSTTTEKTPLIVENNELNDNKFASNVELDLEVNPQMVPLLSGSDVSEGGKSPQLDVDQPQAYMVSVEETADGNAESVNVSSKKDGVDVDLNFSGKVNLDQSSCDDFMDEDVAETKQTVVMTDCEETKTNAEKVEVSASMDEVHVDIVGEEVSAERKASDAEEKNLPAMTSVKRKLNNQLPVGNPDVGKRQRRWNPVGLKVPEARADDISTTPKDVVPQETTPKGVVQLPFKRSLSMSDSSVNEEVPKERVVPPSANPPTNSLRIDHFLRPFTLKAVQELLGKTGTVGSFWMDQIKTHCYVSYSSVDEAIETRNAVYNLHWPPNGGRQLVAEFVDPQEVKVRLEASLKAPAPAVSVKSGASVLHVGQNAQPLPSPRPHVPKQQLPQQTLPPPPPTLPNPPLVREQVYQPAREHIPVRERLTLPPPPPPPLAAKAEAPILTLDDLFRKTKATPRIYYLPLSDEQVAAKLQAQGKTVKQ